MTERMKNKYDIIDGAEAYDVIENILSKHMFGRLCMKGGEYPYAILFNHIVLNDKIILHTGFSGKKIEEIRRDPHVCYEIDGRWEPKDTKICHANFDSLCIFGTVEEIVDVEERGRLLRAFCEPYHWPYKASDEERCNILVIHPDYATARVGDLRAPADGSKKKLYHYTF